MIKLRPVKRDLSSKHEPVAEIWPPSLLIAKSKKLGQVATRAFFDVKQFLKKDIALPAALKQFIPKSEVNEQQETSAKSKASKAKEQIADLKKVVTLSHEVLASARSVFPFALFPDDIILDRTKVTILKRDFFWSKNIISIRIEDILNVSASTGPFFGSVNISSRVMNSTDHFSIDYFYKKDAIYLKRIIQGYMIAQHNNIDTSNLAKKELIDTLCELGEDTRR